MFKAKKENFEIIGGRELDNQEGEMPWWRCRLLVHLLYSNYSIKKFKAKNIKPSMPKASVFNFKIMLRTEVFYSNFKTILLPSKNFQNNQKQLEH